MVAGAGFLWELMVVFVVVNGSIGGGGADFCGGACSG